MCEIPRSLNFCVGCDMKRHEIGVLTSAIKVFVGMESTKYAVLISKDPNKGKWTIRMSVVGQENGYFLQGQRGGMRLFAHLEGAIRCVLERFEGVTNVAIQVDGKTFLIEGADMKNVREKLFRGRVDDPV